MKTHQVLLLFIVLFCSRAVSGQTNELIKLDTRIYDNSALFSTSSTVRLAIPLQRNNTQMWMLSPEFKSLQTRTTDSLEASRYNRFSLRLVGQRTLPKAWKMQWLALTSIGSGFTTTNDLIVNAALRFGQTRSNITYTFGLAYSYRYRNNILTPVAGIVWKPEENWLISAKLPAMIRMTHTVKPGWEVGAEYAGNGLSSLLNSGDLAFMWMRERNLLLTTGFRLTRYGWVTCAAGYTLKRSLKTYQLPEHPIWTLKTNWGEPRLTPTSEYNESGFMAQIGISFRMGRDFAK
jgi:hypothetical protein